MKKLTLSFIMASSIIVGINKVEATTIQDSKKATFDIVDNPDGTIILEAQDLMFGSHTIIPDEINAKTVHDSSINITEFSGKKPGWKLKVQLNKFKDSSNDASIDGVRLFYPKVTPITTTGGDASSNAPTTLGTQESFLDSLLGTVVNDNDTQVTISEAEAGKGFGKWELPYKNTNRIQLNIPTGQRIGSYSAVVTYTIESSP